MTKPILREILKEVVQEMVDKPVRNAPSKDGHSGLGISLDYVLIVIRIIDGKVYLHSFGHISERKQPFDFADPENTMEDFKEWFAEFLSSVG